MKKKTPRQVYILGLVSLFNDISSEMLYPILPVFLTQVIGAPVYVLGIIEGFAEGSASFLKTYFGFLSDKLNKRKGFVFAGYFLSACSKLIIALSNLWGVVFAGRLTDKLGKGLRTGARDAMLLGYSDESNRGYIFGLHRSFDSAGAVVGPLIALLLLGIWNDSLRTIIFIAVIPGFIGLILFSFVKEVTFEKSAKPIKFFASIKTFPKNFKVLLTGLAIFSLGNSSDTFLILKSKDIGLSITMVIMAYIIYNAVYSGFSVMAGKLADRVGKTKIFFWGLLIYAVVYIGFALNTSFAGVFILFFIYGFYIAMTDGIAKAIAGSLVQKEESGTAFGLMQTVIGLSTLLASIIGGFLWSLVSPESTFYFGAVCAAAAFVYLAVNFRPSPGKA